MIATIRMDASHVSAVARLYHDAWHETQARFQDPRIAAFRDETFFLRRVEAVLTTSIVAECDGRCVGFGSWKVDELDYLFVAPDARQVGIGRSLLAACENAMSAAGVGEAWLNCSAGNSDARRFYERHGWRCSETRALPVAFADGTIDVSAWKMIKPLAGRSARVGRGVGS